MFHDFVMQSPCSGPYELAYGKRERISSCRY